MIFFSTSWSSAIQLRGGTAIRFSRALRLLLCVVKTVVHPGGTWRITLNTMVTGRVSRISGTITEEGEALVTTRRINVEG